MTPRFLSLKWRIAAWYAALLVFVLAITSWILVWRFGSIIEAQARARADTTMNEVLAVANPAGAPIGLQDVAANAPPLAILLNSDNLVYWASPSTSIEIDTPAGYPMVKSANLGRGRIARAAVDAARPAAFREIQVRGEPAIVEDRFVRIGGTTNAVVQVAQSLTTVAGAIAQARETVLVVLAVAIVAAILLSIVLASEAINPINALSKAMREIGLERLGRRLAWPRNDEIGELAQSFDDLLARLEASFARERQFIADASHELKTPLTSINANAQMLLRWAERDERIRRESVETIARESSAVGEMVNGMLTLAKADRGDDIPREPVSLIEEARDVTRYAQPRAQEKGLALDFEQASDSAIVLADASLVRQMIGNLVDNAIKFTDSGSVGVRAGSGDALGWVEVRDTGPGIARSELPRIFERFYRADRSRSRSVPGTGLGLAIVRSIARVHGGSVEASDNPGGGSLFRVTIPLLAMLAAMVFSCAVARADDIPTTASPVVNVVLHTGTLSVRTWRQNAVAIVTGGRVSWKRFDARTTAGRIPVAINSWAVSTETPRGPVSLPAERFEIPALPPGPHDAVVASGAGDTTVWVPSGAALVVVRVIAGTLRVFGYDGVLVAHVRHGAAELQHVAGSAYIQVVSGRIVAVGSHFDRIRARTAVGGIFFERCEADQIDATAARGNILYDDGRFEQGPAYFSTGEGGIAIGLAAGRATISGRSASGRVIVASGDRLSGHTSGGISTIQFGGGGPFVTASAQGAIAVYGGALVRHPALLQRTALARGLPRAFFSEPTRPRSPDRSSGRRGPQSHASRGGLQSPVRARPDRVR